MIEDEALGVLGTRIVCAWIYADVVTTRFAARTFVIGMAFHVDAVCERISFQSRWTSARRPMVSSVALSTDRAWIIDQTRVYTLTVRTLFVICAFAVVLASDFSATDLSISRVSWLAEANRMVVGNDAFCVLPTIARIYTTGIVT